jgi:hypothetical protein
VAKRSEDKKRVRKLGAEKLRRKEWMGDKEKNMNCTTDNM